MRFPRGISKAKTALILFSLIATLLVRPNNACGQSALDGFDPNANFPIDVVVVQPDGKILLGGQFTTLSPNGGAPVTRNGLARLNPDGTIDTTFDPNVSLHFESGRATVYAIVVQADGKILVGGYFDTIGGVTRNRIARLDASTGLVDSFDPSLNGFHPSVNSIAVQADGKILVGGSFSTIGGQTRIGIARLDATSGLADSFNPNADGNVEVITVQADGNILAGGSFTSIGGQPRNNMARLDPTTGLADSFDPNVSSSFGSVVVNTIAVQADGKVLAGGRFTTIGGEPRNHVARLNTVTGLADSFDPNATVSSANAPDVRAIALQTDGKILVGGYFTTIGGRSRNHIARFDATTGLIDSFNPNVSSTNATVLAIAVQADGKILVGGDFNGANSIGGQTRNRIARLETDGRLDQTLDLNAVGFAAIAVAVQPDGKILIGGSFSSVLGVTRSNIARLNADGTLDTGFDPNANSRVIAFAVQADGKILAGGWFRSIGGQTRNFIARLDPSTGLADSFNPNANLYVNTITVQTDGKILVGGEFTGNNSIGGQTRARIARLDPITGLADSFNPTAYSTVYSIALQPDGKILVCGVFDHIGGAPRNYIARLDPVTGLADSFNPNAQIGGVSTIVIQADGKILAGGSFTGIGGQSRNHVARLDPVTGLADSFNPNANGTVDSFAVQADGKILAGGGFQSIGGQTRNRIARLDATTGLADSFDPNANGSIYAIALQADGKILMGGGLPLAEPRKIFVRLSNDTAALQNLAVTQSSIIWTRGGSSPQLASVAFESSTDNVSYSPLGDGMPAGNNWTLTGLNFPAGQNLYIRARGYYRGGSLNNSESVTESVRLAVPGGLQLTGAVSRKTHGAAGNFDINLPLSGGLGVECRTSGGNHTLVFTMSNNLVSGNASVTTGTGSVSGSPSVAGNTMTVNLTGVTNVQKITVTLSGVTDSFAQILPNTAVSVNMLIGDTNGDRSVGVSDLMQTKAQSGAAVTAANFREDVNIDGAITNSDVSLVKSKSGTALP